MKKNMRLKCGILTIFLLLAFTGCTCAAREREFREGDVLLQDFQGDFADLITGVTHSKYAHCGLVVSENNSLIVIEAIGPVRYTPLGQWLRQGSGGKYAHLRPAGISKEKLAAVSSEAKKFLGLPYDDIFELDDEKIYCSELVYKAFLRGAKVEVGKKEKLGDFDWKPYESAIRKMAGGEVPLERIMVTPESVANSPRLKLVYTDFGK